MMQTRTAIFGGSFNPIHNGHIALANQILEDGWADEVWLLVSPQNPLKQQKDLLDENVRLHLAQKALSQYPKIKASDFEFHLPRPSYTWDTLCALQQTYPERDFMLLIGADNWLIFNKWAHHQDIIDNFPILIYPRAGYNIDINALPKTIRFIDAPLFPYSSTDVRKTIATINEMVPSSILQELINEKYYK